MMMLFASITYTVAASNIDNSDEKPRIEDISNLVVENVKKTDFSTLSVGFPAKVNVIEGDSVKIDVRSADKWLQDKIKYEISDSTLRIWASCSPEQLENLDPSLTKIRVVIPHNIRIKTTSQYLLMIPRDEFEKYHTASNETEN